MLRFIHTADWQIGMRAAHVGAAGEAVRSARLLAAGNAVQVAIETQAQFILVAGDTFEDHAVDRQLVRQVAETLAAFPGPVFLLPGNHDPWVAGSIWSHAVWKSRPNLRLLSETEPVPIDGGWLLPCPARAAHSAHDPTLRIAADTTSQAGFRIGVAHGTVEGLEQAEPDYPIARTAADRGRLDYLALGHWHSWATYAAADGGPRMAYSGTHETTKFGERASGHVLLIEIDSPGAPPRVTPHSTGVLRWHQLDEELKQPGQLAAVRRKIEALASRDTALIDLRLSGSLYEDERDEWQRVERLLAEEFLFGRARIEGLRSAPQGDSWIDQLPVGPVRETALRLSRWADPDCTEPRPEGTLPETAAQALHELYHLQADQGSTT